MRNGDLVLAKAAAEPTLARRRNSDHNDMTTNTATRKTAKPAKVQPIAKKTQQENLIKPLPVTIRSLDYTNVRTGKNGSLEFTPFCDIPTQKREVMFMHEWLDIIASVVEAGIVPQFGWVQFIFGTRETFEDFIENYRYYDQEFRTHDRWWWALAHLTNTTDETCFVTSEDIADQLIEFAKESGQIPS